MLNFKNRINVCVLCDLFIYFVSLITGDISRNLKEVNKYKINSYTFLLCVTNRIDKSLST